MEDTIIIRFKGGLGNQMFEYALYRELEYQGKKVKADLTYYAEREEYMPFVLDKVFPKLGITYAEPDELEYYMKKQKKKTVVEKGLAKVFRGMRCYTSEKKNGIFDKNIFGVKKGFLDGYWQSEKYFLDVREILQSEFTFSKERAGLEEMEKQIPENAVSVHIRRGDYLASAEVYGSICTMEYYRKAMAYMKKKLETPIFVVFSDDMAWSKETFRGDEFVFLERHKADYEDWFDMYLMSRCQHNIIANSSFSWWGTWLNKNENKITVAPNRWINGEKTTDIWCENWRKI